MQQPAQMIPVMPSFPPTNITTDQIQKYLDENKKLILAILDNQNLGKLAECAQYQAQLQKNLMYLAAIADAQPQAPTIPTQMAPHPAMQQGGFYMQHPQAAPMGQQPGGIFPAKVPLQFNNPHQVQDLHHQQQLLHQHQQAIQQGQMGMRPGASGPNNSIHSTHPEAAPKTAGPSEIRAGAKQDAPGAGAQSAGADAQGGSASGQGGEEAK